jgi:hypothetical protein
VLFEKQRTSYALSLSLPTALRSSVHAAPDYNHEAVPEAHGIVDPFREVAPSPVTLTLTLASPFNSDTLTLAHAHARPRPRSPAPTLALAIAPSPTPSPPVTLQ